MRFDFLNSRILRANGLEWVNRHKEIKAVM
jgi:hypothetical protein